MSTTNIITPSILLENMLFFIKSVIFVNKGTDNDKALDRCVTLYNKLADIQLAINKKNDTKENNDYLRVVIKRINLVLKTDNDCKQLDLADKSVQTKCAILPIHPAIKSDDLMQLIDYAESTQINLLKDIPLSFILSQSKYQTIIWQYLRCIFYITQALISFTTDPTMTVRQQLYNEALDCISTITNIISNNDNMKKMTESFKNDTFLNKKLVNINSGQIETVEATNEIKKMFERKGVKKNKILDSVLNKITSALGGQNMTSAPNLMLMVNDIVSGLSGDVGNPEDLTDLFGTVKEVLQDTLSQAKPEDIDDLPMETITMMQNLANIDPSNEPDDETQEKLQEYIANNGLNGNINELVENLGKINMPNKSN